ncbi:MAG: HflC protein [Desulfobulbaceae bacterium A2]|nr:MAG: HflC protein [Desulfobulbaceae bacterium A2]
MKQILQIALLALVALVGFTLWDGFYVLEEGKQAVITQFGAPVSTPVTDAGLHFKTPFIQEVRLFEKKVMIWDGDPNQIPTNDKTFIYIDTTARWRIVDALKFLQAVNNEARAMTLLDDIIDGTVRDLVNKNDLSEIIRSSDWTPDYVESIINRSDQVDPPQYGRDKISLMVLEAAAKVTPQYGIELLDVMFKRVNYIDSVRAKVYDRMISERKRIAAEKRSLGEGSKAEILGRVERELLEITSTAEKEAIQIRGAADAEAVRIYGNAYSSQAEFYSFMKTLETYRAMKGDNLSLVISSDSDIFRLLRQTEKNKR